MTLTTILFILVNMFLRIFHIPEMQPYKWDTMLAWETYSLVKYKTILHIAMKAYFQSL